MARGDLHAEDVSTKRKESLESQFEFWGIEADPASAIDEPDESFFLWPEHVEAYALFLSLQTQWRYGLNGPTGLDYAAVLAHMRAIKVPRRRFEDLYAAVRVMEHGALIGFAEMRADNGES